MSGTCFADDTVLYPNPAILSVYLKPSCLTKYVEVQPALCSGWQLNRRTSNLTTGMIVESLPHQQYRVRVHGSGRITLRNRQFLRRIIPLQQAPSISMPNIEADTPPEPLSGTQDIQLPDNSYEDGIENLFDDLSPPLSSPPEAPPSDTLENQSASVPRPGSGPDIASAPVIRRSSRPAKPNSMFDDYIKS